jgi:hypothetical protein
LPLLPESVLVVGAAATDLCQLLEPGLRWAKTNGIMLPAVTATTVEALQILAARSSKGISGICGVPDGQVAATIPSVLTTAQMARLLGTGERNITARARRGSLPGRKAPGGGSKGAPGWVFDVAAVAELVGPSVVAEMLDAAEVA